MNETILLGLTIDYGPYEMMDFYTPANICNHSDTAGRKLLFLLTICTIFKYRFTLILILLYNTF